MRVVPMHDEALAIAEIKALSANAKNHLSHVLRNGLMRIMSAGQKSFTDVKCEIKQVEKEIKEMGL